jgi:hypothetical protein
MNALPMCDDLFLKFFDPWYRDEGRKQRPFKGTFPDIMQHPSFIGRPQSEISPLRAEFQEKVLFQIATMVEAARQDMRSYLTVGHDIDLAWIDAFDCYADRPRVQDLINTSDPKKLGNSYVVSCCEFGAALSHVFRTEVPRLIWRLDWPYWDSSLVDPQTGTAITVFHWAIKKMSEYGMDDGYAAKTKACIQFLNEGRTLGKSAP